MRIHHSCGIAVLCLATIPVHPVIAQTTVYAVNPSSQTLRTAAPSAVNKDAQSPPEAKPKQCSPDASNNFLVCTQGPDALKGLHWGVGFLYTSRFGGVGDVGLVKSGNDNVVRVSRANSAAARAAFEIHYYIPVSNKPVQWAVGPFISLNSKPLNDFGGSPALSSLGAGLMIGANAYVDDVSGQSVSHSVNLGLGWMVDTAIKELAPGVVDGQATTLAQDQLTRTTTKNGFMAILSYNFALN